MFCCFRLVCSNEQIMIFFLSVAFWHRLLQLPQQCARRSNLSDGEGESTGCWCRRRSELCSCHQASRQSYSCWRRQAQAEEIEEHSCAALPRRRLPGVPTMRSALAGDRMPRLFRKCLSIRSIKFIYFQN